MTAALKPVIAAAERCPSYYSATLNSETDYPTVQGTVQVDVAIIGGGMSGLAACAALRFMGVPAEIFDQSPEGFEGPWATTARMETLRSPKQLTGPALGKPALTFRAWFESQFGLEAWEALDKIPRLQWMDYLRWYRRVTRADVRNEHAVTAVRPRADALVENFRAGYLERIGLGPDVLHAENPRLIIGRISGYGQDGPYRDKPAFGAIGEAMEIRPAFTSASCSPTIW